MSELITSQSLSEVNSKAVRSDISGMFCSEVRSQRQITDLVRITTF
jgi:hypothetical protein